MKTKKTLPTVCVAPLRARFHKAFTRFKWNGPKKEIVTLELEFVHSNCNAVENITESQARKLFLKLKKRFEP